MTAPAAKQPQAFDIIVAVTFAQEGDGKLSLDPSDPGNWTPGDGRKLRGTRWGFSAQAYPDLDIENLDRAHATGLAFAHVWMPAKCQLMPPKLGVLMFDAAFQHGTNGATRMLQRALGLADDGNLGRVSLERMDAIAALNLSRLCVEFQAERLLHMTEQPSWHADQHGLARRLFTVMLAGAQFNTPLRDPPAREVAA